MRDASFFACVVQALLAAYVGRVLGRGAQTAARRTLARMMVRLGLYSASLGAYYGVPIDTSLAGISAADVALIFGALALLDYFAFARWVAAGAAPAHSPSVPRWVRWSVWGTLVVLVSLAPLAKRAPAMLAWRGPLLLSEMLVMILATLATLVRAGRAGMASAGRYLRAGLWLVAPIVFNLVLDTLPIHTPAWMFRLVRDLGVMAFEVSMLTAYLDEGHEPMSLGERIVAGVLLAMLSMATVFGYLLLPLLPSTASEGEHVLGHVGVVRMAVCVSAASIAMTVLVPRLFRSSILAPIARLSGGFAKAEQGARVELPVERGDELSQLAGSFNHMVAALDDGRRALAAQLDALRARQAEIDALNEELRGQVAARSRQLADALRARGSSPESIAPGALLDDKYEVGERLGAGAMGAVFAARRRGDPRSLALKVVSSASPDEAVRFLREAELAATFSHPSLVSVIDVGMHYGTPYFVMERLAGGSLAEARAHYGDAAFVRATLAAVARGLTVLHARGVLHRDLKPANVLLAESPRTGERPIAKIADFGISSGSIVDELGATMKHSDGLALAETAPGAVAGTLPYIAPELARGPHAYGTAADIFALGVTGWELLTGHHPFAVPPIFTAMSGGALTMPVIDEALSVEARAIGAVVLRCLAVDPAARPSAVALVGELGEA